MLTLGVPIQVRGVRPAATSTIHWQRVSCTPTPAISELSSCEISTMNTQPPP